MDPNTSLGQLLSGIFSGGYGLNQLFGGGSSSAAGSAAAGAASPFQSQFAQYQGSISPQISAIQGAQGQAGQYLVGQANALDAVGAQANTGVSGLVGNINGIVSGTGGLNTNAGSVSGSISGSGNSLAQQLSALSSNYMANPAIQSELQTGLGAVNASQAAQGMVGSGAQQLALQNYGQNFAAQEYNQQFNNLINGSNASFNQNVGATQLGAALQGQTFNQGLSQMQSLLSETLGQGNLELGGAQAQLGALGTAGGLLGNNAQLQLNSGQGLLNSLMGLSGATTGSPATAGSILSGQFANSQAGAGNIAGGLGGIGGALSSLFGGSGSGLGGDLASLLGGLGSSGIGSIFSGGGAADTVFGNSVTDLGGLTNNILGDVGSGLSGVSEGIGSGAASDVLGSLF
jgi:hypothetical protein